MISSWGATEDQLMNEYKNIRQAARGKKRNARYGTRSGRQYSRAGGPRKPRSPDHRNIHGSVSFFIPEAAYREDEEHVATLVLQRGGDSQKALRFLGALASAVEWIAAEVYGEFETEARERLAKRDPEDWPILTSALALGCPILDGRHRLLRLRASQRGHPIACRCSVANSSEAGCSDTCSKQNPLTVSTKQPSTQQPDAGADFRGSNRVNFLEVSTSSNSVSRP